MTEESSATGIAPPVEIAVALAREVVAQDRADAEAFRAFKTSLLEKLNELSARRDLTRDAALTLLKTMYQCLSPVFAIPDEGDSSPTEISVVANHPSFELMSALIDAVADLDNGKTHNALVATTGRNAALPAHEVRRDDLIRASVYIVERAKKSPNRAVAEREVATNLRKHKYQIRGKPPTQRQIKSIIDRLEKPLRDSADRDSMPAGQRRGRGRPKKK